MQDASLALFALCIICPRWCPMHLQVFVYFKLYSRSRPKIFMPASAAGSIPKTPSRKSLIMPWGLSDLISDKCQWSPDGKRIIFYRNDSIGSPGLVTVHFAPFERSPNTSSDFTSKRPHSMQPQIIANYDSIKI
jgi:hypothetical protein